MSRHDSPPSRRDDFSGMPFPPSAFPGEQRDVAVPQEFIPALARGLMAPPPVATAASSRPKDSIVPPGLLEPDPAKPEERELEQRPKEEPTPLSPTMADHPDLGSLLDLLAADPLGQSGSSGLSSGLTGRPLAVPTPSIQELAGSLLAPPAAPRPAPSRSLSAPVPAPMGPQKMETPVPPSAIPPATPAAFSLADLAGQLSSRFVDQPSGGAGDLMTPSSDFLTDRHPGDMEAKTNLMEETEDDWSMDMLLPDPPAKAAFPAPGPPAPASPSPIPEPGPAISPALPFSLAPGPAAPAASAAAGGLLPVARPLPPPPPTRPGALNRAATPLPPPAALAAKARPVPVAVPAPDPAPAPVVVPDTLKPDPDPELEPRSTGEEKPPPAPETHPLFHGQPLSPAPQPPPLPLSSLRGDSESSSGGLVLTLGGAGLILMGVLLACTLPLLWLDLDSQPDEWSRQVTRAGMLVRAAGAAGLMALGLGSLFQRRWAPPLIHATGWVWAFVSSGILAAAAWHAMSSDAAAGSSGFTGMADLLPTLAGLAVPLGMILLYQRPDLPGLCAGADSRTRWTDGLAIPGVMVFVCGILITVPAMVMLLCYPAAMPLPTFQILSGAPAVAAWSVVAALGLGVACAALRRSRWAWWLLLAATGILAAGPALAGFSSGLWSDFLTALAKPAAAAGVPSLTALLAGLSPLPAALVLVMARRAFPSPSSVSVSSLS